MRIWITIIVSWARKEFCNFFYISIVSALLVRMNYLRSNLIERVLLRTCTGAYCTNDACWNLFWNCAVKHFDEYFGRFCGIVWLLHNRLSCFKQELGTVIVSELFITKIHSNVRFYLNVYNYCQIYINVYNYSTKIIRKPL